MCMESTCLSVCLCVYCMECGCGCGAFFRSFFLLRDRQEIERIKEGGGKQTKESKKRKKGRQRERERDKFKERNKRGPDRDIIERLE